MKTKEEIIKCQAKREVSSCKECCRFDECFNGKRHIFDPEKPFTSGEKRLLTQIVIQKILDYKEAWRTGAKNELTLCENFLQCGKVELFTLGDFSSDYVYNHTKEECLKKYGLFENIYNKKVKWCKKQLEPLYAKLEKMEEPYLIKVRLTDEEQRFLAKYEASEEKRKTIRTEMALLAFSKKDLIKRERLRKKIKRLQPTDKEKEYYKFLLRKLRLNKRDKMRYSRLCKKIKLALDYLNE